ncbi:type IV secretory system conjugative DNA transfer family protein [Roseibium sp. HPY-6]|uniref:type IV secretory system conjugative DNA transfer family protein n=1 Tax=Roseibium sp. HPY-6 TaxID=3229852 RepID=UPI00338EC2B6
MAFILWAVTLIAAITFLRTIGIVIARKYGVWNPDYFHRLIWFPWRQLLQGWVRFTEWQEEVFRTGSGATAGFAGFLARVTFVFKPDYALLGRLRFLGFNLLQPLGFKAERHLAMIAGTGAGKTTFLITILGLHKGNAFVIDPKGQITKVIANRRGLGGNGIRGLGKQVAVLDPYNTVPNHKTASWNALDELMRVERREGKHAVVKYSMKMAEAIVPMEGSKPYFPQTARQFLQSLILHVYTTEPPIKRNLVRVRELATRGYHEHIDPNKADPFAFLVHQMQQNNAYDGTISNAAATLAGTGKSLGDVLSTMRAALKFLDIPEVRDISRHSDFSLEDLKLGDLNLFVCAPTNAIREELSNWFRLLTVTSLDLFEKIPGNLEHACLFAVDEMPSLGYIEAIETSAPVMRSYGVRLLAISQDLEKMQKAYPQGWKGFIGNADAVYWMATNENDTATYLANKIGEKTRTEKSGWIPFFKKKVGTKTENVLTPDQVRRFLDPRKQMMIVTRFGKRALRVGTMPYYRELPVAFYEHDTDHRETSGRAATRSRLIAYSSSRSKKQHKGAVPHAPQQKGHQSNTAQATSIAYNDALNIFGLVEPFTIFELDKRKAMLMSTAKSSNAGSHHISDAYDLLKSKATT